MTLSNPGVLADFAEVIGGFIADHKMRLQKYQQVDGQASGDLLEARRGCGGSHKRFVDEGRAQPRADADADARGQGDVRYARRRRLADPGAVA